MSRTVLIVDDSEIERALLTNLLGKDYTPLEAENGEAALALINHKYKLISAIILDIVMPGLDGFEVLRAIRQNVFCQGIPVIVTTGLADGHAQEQAAMLGANGFIAKPYRPDLLLHTVRNAIELHEKSAILNVVWRDKLTGLLNRESFLTEAERLIQRQEAGYYVLACFDVDNFKLINDQYGTAMGDAVLRHIAASISAFVAKTEGLASRIAADKFALLYPAALRDSAETRLSQVLVASPEGLSQKIGMRIGRYVISDLSLSLSAMFDRASLAEEAIRGSYGVSVAEYSESMRTRLLNEQRIVNDMGRALAAGEFEPWFQPQYNHATGAIIGAEALVRWKKDGAFIPPADFVPIFERNGFIYQMDQSIWEQVCRWLRRRLDAGRAPLPVSINISRRDLLQEDCLSTLTGLIDRYAVPHALIHLEVTESAFSEATGQILARVGELIKQGFTVEIDDFGSGYSSLNTLKDVPAGVLKLDMRFFENTKNQQRGGNIVGSVVRMAKWLGMTVIAEGVEKKKQADYLKSIGCYYIQGYYYARPMPLDAYETLLDTSPRESAPVRPHLLEPLDNNEFWNPDSMETLIFNTYVGGACIFEFRDGKAELLRMNDQYLAELNGLLPVGTQLAQASLVPYLDAEGQEALRGCLQTAIRTQREAACEARLVHAARTEYIRFTIRLLAREDNRYLFYCVIVNITAEKETAGQLRFLNDSAHDILAQPDAEQAVNLTLRKLLTYFAAARSYVVELDRDRPLSSNTYEVCAAGVRPELGNLQNIPVDVSTAWYKELARNNCVILKDISQLGENEASLRRLLLAQDIRSLILAPLWRDAVLIGFVGLDNPARAKEQVERLTALADYIAVLLTRRDLNRKIARDTSAMRTLINDTPGGFLRMAVPEDARPSIAGLNDGLCRMLGMTRAEALAAYGADALLCLTPEDIDRVRADAAVARASCGQFTTTCRLRRKTGAPVWTMVFGRFVRDETGKMFLNAYFTDITAQKKTEEQQIELLDKLPSGAALYAFDGKALSIIHINKQYWKLVEREPANGTVFEAIHPNDRAIVRQEMEAAIRQKRNCALDIRIRCGHSGYKPFHVTANITPGANGAWLFFTSYTPISDRAMSVQEMLPVALATMMSASEDLSYVKDKDLHYICCSQSVADLLGLDSARDVLGKTDLDLFGAAVAKKFMAADADILAHGASQIDTLEKLPAADGGLRLFNTSKYPLTDASGMVIGLYGVSRDITAQREKESRLELLASSVPGGLATYVCTPGDVRLVYYNDGFLALVGCTREEFDRQWKKDTSRLVFEEDLPVTEARLQELIANSKPVECVYRIHTKGGGYKWIKLRAAVADRTGDAVTINTVLVDITEQQNEKEQLRLREEEYRLVAAHSNRTICRYNIADHTLEVSAETAKRLALPERVPDIPYGRVRQGLLSPDTVAAYVAFYERILRGEKESTATFQKKLGTGWRWLNAQATAILDKNGKPVSAIISYLDVTEQQEKEAVYRKWQQSLHERKPASYTLYRTNLNKDAGFDTREGALLDFLPDESAAKPFNARVRDFADRHVCAEERPRYIDFLNSDTLLAGYYRGRHSVSMDFRARLANDVIRWLRLSVELVEYPNSTDVQAYLLYEDINDSKMEEIQTRTQAESDPLTGLLNRNAFEKQTNQALAQARKDRLCALFLLDMDGFKLINDCFGHAVGDKVLIDASAAIRSVLRPADLACRMGGDEFLVCLCDMPDRDSILKKARQLCDLTHKSFNLDVRVSISLGIAVCPADGASFKPLYAKADKALYHVKGHGKDGCAFYSTHMDDAPARDIAPKPASSLRRNMLIVDDNEINRLLLKNIFENDFTVDTVDNGQDALVYLRRHGLGVSVVLLDLLMPNMDGFAVLDKMRGSPEMQMIPVIVVSAEDNRETTLRAIRAGASDYVTKPIDADLLRIRVTAAISKVENERARVESYNRALQHKNA